MPGADTYAPCACLTGCAAGAAAGGSLSTASSPQPHPVLLDDDPDQDPPGPGPDGPMEALERIEVREAAEQLVRSWEHRGAPHLLHPRSATGLRLMVAPSPMSPCMQAGHALPLPLPLPLP
jgi:hypothetical protein